MPTLIDPLRLLQLPSLGRLSDRLQDLVRTRLWLKVVIAAALGVGVGLLLGPDVGLVPSSISQPLVSWLALPGGLFLALIQMIVVPLVFASVVRGLTASDDMEQLRRVGTRALLFFVTTTAGAASLGIGLSSVLRPGRYIDVTKLTGPSSAPPPVAKEFPSVDAIPQALTDLLPNNPLAAMVGGQMLQIILFAVLMGLALLTLAPEKSAPLYEFLGSLQEVCMTVVKWAMRLAPLAVFGLLARLTASVGVETLAGMGAYMLTVLAGLFLLAIGYLVLVWVMARTSPLAFIRGSRELLLLAFSTSSSAAVMPLSIQTAERNFHVSTSTARFIVPLGATINMTGTALYQGVATVFLAQVFGIELSTPTLVLVVVTAVAASIGSPATPGVGMVILGGLLTTAGIPSSGIVLLLGVDRLLDMSRTAVNVAGDLAACLIIDPQGSVVSDPVPSSSARSS